MHVRARALVVALCCFVSLALVAPPAYSAMPLDIDGDGFGDLPVPAPSEDLGATQDVGTVDVFFGGANGVSGARDALVTPGGNVTGNDEFGRAVAVGDFDGDGFADLAIGVPGATVGGAFAAGAIDVVNGAPSGVGAHERATQATSGIPGAPEALDRFGWSLAAADFDGDGRDDLAVGAPGEGIGAASKAGVVYVFPGSGGGLQWSSARVFSQDSNGVPSTSEADDQFGFALAAGDANNDTFADLAIGAPMEDAPGMPDVGVAHILNGRASGVTTTANAFLWQNASGVGGVAEDGDVFGWSLAFGDFDGDAHDDLLVGAPGETVGTREDAGVVHVLRATDFGVGSDGNVVLLQGIGGITGGAETGDVFGYSLATGEFDGDTFADAAIAAPGEGIGGIARAGVVHTLLGDSVGLQSAGSQMWSQLSYGIATHPTDTELFGAFLWVTDLTGDAYAELAIGVPGETVSSHPFAGALHVLDGTPNGPTGTGSALLTQDAAGVVGSAEDDDWFGGSFSF